MYCESPHARPTIMEALKFDHKFLLPYLRFAFLGRDYILLVIIAAHLNGHQVECFVAVLMRFKQAIGWTFVDTIDIPPGILFLQNLTHARSQTSLKHQRRMNTPMQEVVKNSSSSV